LERERFNAGGFSARVFVCNTAIVGTGAAGYNAADRLWDLGQHDILIITENRTGGTSRNTGSDKQTYYKLTLSGSVPDSVGEMAETLFSGQCVDGDIALCEAALSVPCFMKLTELGVAFPRNRFGEFVGYKTDHDPRSRATSVGPYTSRQMTEKLEASVQQKSIPVLDRMQVIRIISDKKQVYGVLCLDVSAQEDEDRFVLVRCRNLIYATGGPAGIYANSVYPVSHYGATGLALEAGVKGKNLTEWQYGLASVKPRWNVSGTYMQVLPRMVSTDENGQDEREFLTDFFEQPEEMLSRVFLKGYQWPFDVRKVENGSSIIDILVYLESCKGRRIFLDYRKNPIDGHFCFEDLDGEAYTYLFKAGACFGTPLERLQHMNAPAVDFYRERGVDLAKEMLEIRLCAQHNNGGLDIDCWWQTNVRGFFACGEAAASHGVYRPGGSALNAGQVGSTRASQYIAARCRGNAPEGWENLADQALLEMGSLAQSCVGEKGNVKELWKQAGERMSLCAGSMRDAQAIGNYYEQVKEWNESFAQRVKIDSPQDLRWVFRLRDMLMCQQAYLFAMADYVRRGGKSRGSALYTDFKGKKPYDKLPDMFTFLLDDGSLGGQVQEILLEDRKCRALWRPVRPIPGEDDFFENIWRSYRENGNIE